MGGGRVRRDLHPGSPLAPLRVASGPFGAQPHPWNDQFAHTEGAPHGQQSVAASARTPYCPPFSVVTATSSPGLGERLTSKCFAWNVSFLVHLPWPQRRDAM